LLKIRDALAEDAPAACALLRRSITELFAADHNNDPAIIERWLANKTVGNVLAWIGQPDNSLLVVEDDHQLLAVGSVTDSGMIGLVYVSPDARFRGVSTALLRALESRAAEHGNLQCELTSSETARRFYLSNGYTGSGPPIGAWGTTGGHR
jgi:GNAT superfamily N-acetyltransferase